MDWINFAFAPIGQFVVLELENDLVFLSGN